MKNIKKTSAKSPKKGLVASFSALSERERKGLTAMGLVLTVLLLALVVGLFQRSLGELERESQHYEKALNWRDLRMVADEMHAFQPKY